MQAALITLTDSVPDDNSVVAGWTAFWIFIALIAAVAFLLWNFTKQLKKTKAAADRGVFGDTEQTQAEAADDEHPATNGG